MKRYYAAYGSNLNIHQMERRCPTAKIVGTGFIDGYELLFKGSKTGSYLTIEPSVRSQVPIAIWEVNPEDEQMLDRYEGFPVFYYKKEMMIPVSLVNGKIRKMKIFVYIMDESREMGLPTVSYVETCLQGYKDFNFDRRFLDQAIRRSSRYNENGSKEKKMSQVPKRIYRVPGSFQKG